MTVTDAAGPSPAETTTTASHDRRRLALRVLWPLILVTVLGAGLRVAIVTWVHPTCPAPDRIETGPSLQSPEKQYECFQLGGDAFYIAYQAQMISEGQGYSSPAIYWSTDRLAPGAGRPPVVPLFQASMRLLGLGGVHEIRVGMALLGSLSVFVIGWVAWQLAGRTAGLVAATLAAFYPNFWTNDWVMNLDGVFTTTIAVVVWAAYRYARRRRPVDAVILGVAVAVAALTRSEASMLAVVLVLPLILLDRRRRLAVNARLAAVALLSLAAVLLPWYVFNLARFNNLTLASVGTGSVLLNGSCEGAYYGDELGSHDLRCFGPEANLDVAAVLFGQPGSDESDADLAFRRIGSRYVAANAQRLPVVAAARLGRMWDLYRPVNTAFRADKIEARGPVAPYVGMVVTWFLLPAGAAGLVLLWRRRVPISPLVGPIVMVCIMTVVSFGLTRYRVPADIALVIGTSVAVTALLRRLGIGTGRDHPEGGPPAIPSTPGPSPTATWVRAHRGAVTGTGVVAVVLLVAVFAWSLAATPVTPEPTGRLRDTEFAQLDPSTRSVCQLVVTLARYPVALGAFSFGYVGRLPFNVRSVRDAAAQGPAETRRVAGRVVADLEPFTGPNAPIMDADQRARAFDAMGELLRFYDATCVPS